MENHLYLINLYDYYGELLTAKQQEYFEDYYFNNFSLTEISENKNISRNAIHKHLKEAANKLEYYEEILHLYQKANQIKELIRNLDQDLVKKIGEII